jgi:hypothetical protein
MLQRKSGLIVILKDSIAFYFGKNVPHCAIIDQGKKVLRLNPLIPGKNNCLRKALGVERQ